MTRRWPYLVCRGSTLLLAVLGVAQAVLAGGFLSGYYDALTMHLFVGSALILIALLQLIAVVPLHRAGGPHSVLHIAVGVLAGLIVQALLGSFRILLLHVPLGVVLIFGLIRMATLVWSAPLPKAASLEAA